jgi:hypothetical protein
MKYIEGVAIWSFGTVLLFTLSIALVSPFCKWDSTEAEMPRDVLLSTCVVTVILQGVLLTATGAMSKQKT